MGPFCRSSTARISGPGARANTRRAIPVAHGWRTEPAGGRGLLGHVGGELVIGKQSGHQRGCYRKFPPARRLGRDRRRRRSILAQAANVDHVVSGDKDLTSLATVSPPVLSPAAFLDLL